MADTGFKEGDDVHALHKVEGWVRGKVKGVGPAGTYDVEELKGARITCKAAEVLLDSTLSRTGIEDMISLDVLHEGAIQENCSVRYHRDDIYTLVGPILVSINPYRRIPGLYGEEAINGVIGSQVYGGEKPHVYGVAERAFADLEDTGKDQSVIVTGESGAGKTEATKLVLEYLTTRSAARGGQGHDAESTVSTRLLEANPVLEAFGNAKTARNDNSSRFGKLLKVQYAPNGDIVGGELTDYLLEKSRVVNLSETDRNYHIFYQLLSGASDDLRGRLKLTSKPADYKILSQSQSRTIPGVNDKAEFEVVSSALTSLGFSSAEEESMMKLVATILHLGNITFEPLDETKSESGSLVSSPVSLKAAAGTLSVSARSLEEALCIKTMQTTRGAGQRSGTVYKLPMEPQQCEACCKSLMKELYACLFSWLIRRINKSTMVSQEGTSMIALLDIFGFEVFETNSFEQLCINFANESLHQQFVNHYFKLEQEEYKKEGVGVGGIEFTDNAAMLELIAGKPLGIYSLLEEQCSMPRTTDQNFADRCKDALGKNKFFERAKKVPCGFVVHHYAGEVTYDAQNFLDKNRDALNPDITKLLATVSMKETFMREVMGSKKRQKGRNATIGSEFTGQVRALMELLNSTQPQYVRCIKPNESKAANNFNGMLVLKQLRYSGVLDSIRIRKMGFAIRRPFSDINGLLGNSSVFWESKEMGPGKCCAAILRHMGIPKEDYRIGTSKVFLKTIETYQKIIEFSNQFLGKHATKIQSHFRARLGRADFQERLAKTKKVTSFAKMVVQRRRYLKIRGNAISVQSAVRRFIAMNKFKKMQADKELLAELARKRREQGAALTIQKRARVALAIRRVRMLREWKSLIGSLTTASRAVQRNGWLFKKGGQNGGRRNWRRRYFTIEKNTLRYFEDADLKVEKGVLKFDDVSSVQVSKRPTRFFSEGRGKTEKECIIIERADSPGAPLAPFVLSSDLEQDIPKWHSALHLYKCMDNLTGAMEELRNNHVPTNHKMEEVKGWFEGLNLTLKE